MSMDASSRDPWQPLLERMKKLKESWPSRGWSWDGRMNTVSSSFSTEFEDKARASAMLALPLQWISSTVGQAHPRLRELCERTGGLRAGQLLLGGEPVGGIVSFGLWWPWGDGETISLRVGLTDVDPMKEPYPRLRDLFGVQL